MQIPEKGMKSAALMRELKAARRRDRDFSGGRILGSMCTEPLAVAKRADAMFVNSNLGNPGLCEGTRDLAHKVMEMCASLFRGDGFAGRITSGATEANIIALWMARNVMRRKKVVLPAHAHFSLHKAADLLGLEKVMISTDENYRMDSSRAIRAARDPDVAAVVCAAGSTELGQVDPIQEIAESISSLVSPPLLHVDAAFGGFVLPFMRDLGMKTPEFDFTIPQVSTVCADPHKMGLGTVPCGSLTVRRPEWFDAITFDSPYLTKAKQGTLLGTRGSAAVPAAYAAMVSLGRQGYREIVKRCIDNTRLLADGFRQLGAEPIIEPVMNILGVKVKDTAAAARAFDDLGWNVSTTRIPSLRFVVMPHVTKKRILELLEDARRLKRKGSL
ncbi:MAG TPA: tyrosine decarboxylase MfnA [Thermoplasmata archaeon]|nr:tyrosine decarboxylase MfnA [Thermoplasmata archaeon]